MHKISQQKWYSFKAEGFIFLYRLSIKAMRLNTFPEGTAVDSFTWAIPSRLKLLAVFEEWSDMSAAHFSYLLSSLNDGKMVQEIDGQIEPASAMMQILY